MSLLFYFLFIVSLLYLCSDKTQGNRTQKIRIAYFWVFFVSATRFNIGNDYEDYVGQINYFLEVLRLHPDLQDAYNQRVVHYEIANIFIIKLFSSFPRPYVWIFATYSLINTFFLYLVLKRDNAHYWGIFIFIVCEFLFVSWDMVRQASAVMICFYAINLLREESFFKQFIFFKYEALVLFASLFHTTALVMIPFFVIRWIRINKWVLIGILIVAVVLMWTGILVSLQEQVAFYATFVDDYEKYATNDSTLQTAESTLYKLRLLLYAILWGQILFHLPEREHVLRFFLTLGGVGFLFAMNSLSIMRLSWYFLVVIIISLPLAINNINGRFYLIWFKRTLFAMLLLFAMDIVRDSNVRGCGTYKSIFSEDFIEERFNSRELQNNHD